MDYSDIPFDRIISNKTKLSYPDYINEEIMLISINKDYSKIIGSASYRIQKYPGDIDLYEGIEKCCSMKDTIDFFVKNLKRIVKNVIDKKNHWFMELKAGLDTRFDINVGFYNHGYFILDPEFILKAKILFDKGLFSREEMELIISIYKNGNRRQYEYETLKTLLRNHIIVRWKANEVLQGYKILPGNVKLTLEEAIKQKSQINIELIAIVNNKITDLSNFFVLAYKDSENNVFMINLPQESYENFIDFFQENLKSSIEKLYYSKLDFNPFKMVKRYWSYGKFMKDQQLINKILPIISSDVALASQLKSELDTIAKLLKKTSSVPVNILKNQLSTFKWRLSNVMLISNELDEEIDIGINQIIKGGLSNNKIIDILEGIKKQLGEIINEKTVKYLETVGLAPPPLNLLPRNPILR